MGGCEDSGLTGGVLRQWTEGRGAKTGLKGGVLRQWTEGRGAKTVDCTCRLGKRGRGAKRVD